MMCPNCGKEIEQKKPSTLRKNTYYKMLNWYNKNEIERYILCLNFKKTGIWEEVIEGYSFFPNSTEIEKHSDYRYLYFDCKDSGNLRYIGLLKEITKEEFFEEIKKIPNNLMNKINKIEEKQNEKTN